MKASVHCLIALNRKIRIGFLCVIFPYFLSAQYSFSRDEFLSFNSIERTRKFLGQIEEPTPANISQLNSYLKHVSDFAEEENDLYLLGFVNLIHEIKGIFFENDPQKRLIIYQNAFSRYKNNKNKLLPGYCLYHIGQTRFLLGEHGLAFEDLMKARELFKDIGYENVPFIGKFIHDYSIDNYTFKNYDTVINELEQSLSLPKFNNNLDIQRYNTLGLAYLKKENYEQSLIKFHQTLKKAGLYNDSVWIRIAFQNLGEVYLDKGNYDSAYFYLYRNYSYNKQWKNVGDLLYDASSAMSKLYLYMDSIPEAVQLIRESEKYLSKEKPQHIGGVLYNKTSEKSYYENMYELFLKTGNYEKAYIYKDSFNMVNQLILENYNSVVVEMSRDKLNIQESKSKIERQEKERSIMLLTFGLLFLVVTIIVLIFFGISRYARLKKERMLWEALSEKKITELEKEKVEIKLAKARSDITKFIENINEKSVLIDKFSTEIRLLKEKFPLGDSDFNQAMNNLRDSKILTKDDWYAFQESFGKLYPNFSHIIKCHFPSVTPAELRYLMLLKLNISHKEMSMVLGIALNSVNVTWKRVKNKLNSADNDTPQSMLNKLEKYIWEQSNEQT